MSVEREGLDAIDRRLLQLLQASGRATWASLGKEVNLSPPAVTDRVHRLEQLGVIRKFRVDLAADELGLPTLAFVAVSIRNPSEHGALLESMKLVPEVQECHVVAGEFDYLLKVRCENSEALARLIREEIRSLPGVARTNTMVALQTVKESGDLPLHPSSGSTQ